MAARKPKQGQLDGGKAAGPFGPQAVGPARKVSGGGGGDGKDGFDSHTGRGLRICLSRCEGTSRKVLQQPYYFQVPPLETFSTQHGFNFTDYETVSKGQFSRTMSRQLRTVEFQTMFVDQDWFFVLFKHKHTGPDPQKLSAQLVHILNTGTPFNLLIGNTVLWDEYDVKMKATLRTLTVEERAGEVDARYVNVTFTEHRDLEIQKDGKGEALPQTYKVQEGDTLRSLAKQFYGEGNAWRVIAKANDLNNFLPDQKLANPGALQPFIKTVFLPAPFAVDKAQSLGKD